MLCDAREVGIRREQSELVANAELGEDRVDGADLNPATPSPIAQLRGLEVVVAIGRQEGQGAEARRDRLLVTGPLKSLEEFLVDEPRGRDQLTAREGALESGDLENLGCGRSRRSASDQTLVSTKRLNPASARACGRIPDPTRACRTDRGAGAARAAR